MARKQPSLAWSPHDRGDGLPSLWTATEGDLSLSVDRSEGACWSFSIRRDGIFVFDKAGLIMHRRGMFNTARDGMTRCEARAKEILERAA